MTSLLASLLPSRRTARSVSVDDYAALVADYALSYGPIPGGGLTGTWGQQQIEQIAGGLEGFARGAYAANDVVFACMAVRLAVFSTIRFVWQRLRQGRPSEMFGSRELRILEQPWTGGTTQDLLTRMIQDADLAGNFYAAVIEDEAVRLRPDWVAIVLEPRTVVQGGKARQVGWHKLGLVYWEGGPGNAEPAVFLPDEVAHFAPTPDPLASYRGMSWLTPVLREISNDKLMARHKGKFFENAATPNLSVSLDKEVKKEAFEKFVETMNAKHQGVDNAYKTLFLGGGADVRVIGTDFKQMDFSATQGHGETRIAAAAGVPPVIVGLSEGLQAATYSNYGQARRRFADGTMHTLWGNAAGTLSTIVPRPATDGRSAVRLWYDTRDVAFLREDRKDAAEIQGRQASTIRSLVDAGYRPDAVVAAVQAEDFGLLDGQHSGLYSVQLQAPGTQADTPTPTEGDGNDS